MVFKSSAKGERSTQTCTELKQCTSANKITIIYTIQHIKKVIKTAKRQTIDSFIQHSECKSKADTWQIIKMS